MTLIDFRYKRKLNLKSLTQQSETLSIEQTRTQELQSFFFFLIHMNYNIKSAEINYYF